ncbi:VOC family protein [Brevibacillus choshinensis]|uniref:VOC family protein n=1 Tax=Brevibacillus choshinensis TaxID=54911 RepID=UPI002E1CB1DC|nr:VOC family protein [Brevibacillus choshinensis]MED4750887.1 VOC family protein [Brevibacillus choshinensis]MED4783015.1 VOC family protein [Brevibacillus choshinensis]
MTIRVNPYLTMNGNAKEAIHFYEKALDAKVLFISTFANQPENPQNPVPASVKDQVAHARIKIGEIELMFSDNFPVQPHQSGNQVAICLSTNDVDKSKQFYEALQQDGQVNMPLQTTSFSPAYAMVTDKFGVTFKIYTEAQQ